MPLGDVFTGVKARWTAKSLSSSIAGGIHFGEAPGNTDMPYVVFTVVSSPVDEVTSGPTGGNVTEYSTTRFQLNLYVKGDMRTASDLADILRPAYQNAPITLAGSTLLKCRFTDETVIKEPKSSSRVYRWTLLFDLTRADSVERSPT